MGHVLPESIAVPRGSSKCPHCIAAPLQLQNPKRMMEQAWNQGVINFKRPTRWLDPVEHLKRASEDYWTPSDYELKRRRVKRRV